MQWFRMYAEVIDDKKIRRIALRTGQNKLVIIGFWTTLLALANGGPKRGELLLSEGQPISDEEIMLDMDLDPNMYHPLMREFIAAGMVGQGVDGTYYIAAWDKRQFKSDNVTARTKAYKRKEKGTAGERSRERSQVVPGNTPDTDTDTEIKDSAAKKPPPPRKSSAHDKKRGELEKHFCTITGIPVPKTKTEAQRKSVGKLWYAPLREILELAGEDVERGKRIISETLTELAGLTITDPNSIIKTARAVSGRGKGTGTVSPDLLKAQKEAYG